MVRGSSRGRVARLFRFGDHLEQVAEWHDSLVVDVAPTADGTGLRAWTAWASQVHGEMQRFDPITDGPHEAVEFEDDGGVLRYGIGLPDRARALAVLGENARLNIRVRERS